MTEAGLYTQKNKIYRQTGRHLELLGWLEHTRPGEEYVGWRVSTPDREREVVFPSRDTALDFLEQVLASQAPDATQENQARARTA